MGGYDMDSGGSNHWDASVSLHFKIMISIRNGASLLKLPIYAKAVPEPKTNCHARNADAWFMEYPPTPLLKKGVSILHLEAYKEAKNTLISNRSTQKHPC